MKTERLSSGQNVMVVRFSELDRMSDEEDSIDSKAIFLKIAEILSDIPEIVAIRTELGLSNQDCVYRNSADLAIATALFETGDAPDQWFERNPHLGRVPEHTGPARAALERAKQTHTRSKLREARGQNGPGRLRPRR